MIAANELRIGNYVNLPDSPFVKWDLRCFKMLDGELFEEDDIDPIPLTYEILLQCGFNQGEIKPHGYYGFSNRKMELDNDFRLTLYDGRLDEPETREFIPELKYIHQLQNLYYCLTGEELICTL